MIADCRETQPSFMQRASDWFSENWPIVAGAALVVIIFCIGRRRLMKYTWNL